MTRKRIDFMSFDGKTEARIGSGDHCVLLQLIGERYNAIVLTDIEAEELGRNLVRMAKQSRESDDS